MSLRAGDLVEVRSHREILATLDERGQLDGLPFMPQMLAYCGKRFHVSKGAHKLCDTVNGTGARKMRAAVFLDELRCDGRVYGGCEMECVIFWKTAWLKRVQEHDRQDMVSDSTSETALARLVSANVTRSAGDSRAATVYSCQAIALPAATSHLSVWELSQYVEDWRSGNAPLSEILSVLTFLVYDTIATSGLGIGTPLRAAYNAWQRIRGGAPYPGRRGKLPANAKTPTNALGLRPGELVRVKDYDQVLETVTENMANRGMAFHAEMVPYCSQTFRVAKSVKRIINEKTGQIQELKNPCVVLQDAPCAGHFTKPLLCPRGMYPYWREVWLDRVEPKNPQSEL